MVSEYVPAVKLKLSKLDTPTVEPGVTVVASIVAFVTLTIGFVPDMVNPVVVAVVNTVPELVTVIEPEVPKSKVRVVEVFPLKRVQVKL